MWWQEVLTTVWAVILIASTWSLFDVISRIYKFDGRMYVNMMVIANGVTHCLRSGNLGLVRSMQRKGAEDDDFTSSLAFKSSDCERLGDGSARSIYIRSTEGERVARQSHRSNFYVRTTDDRTSDTTYMSLSAFAGGEKEPKQYLEINATKLCLKLLTNIAMLQVVETLASLLGLTTSIIARTMDENVANYFGYALLVHSAVLLLMKTTYATAIGGYAGPMIGNAVDAVSQRNGICFKLGDEPVNSDVVESFPTGATRYGPMVVYKRASWKAFMWVAPTTDARRKAWLEHPGIGLQYAQAVDASEDSHTYMDQSTVAMAALSGSYTLGLILVIFAGIAQEQVLTQNISLFAGATLALLTSIVTFAFGSMIQFCNSVVQIQRARNIVLEMNGQATLARNVDIEKFMLRNKRAQDRIKSLIYRTMLWTIVRQLDKSKSTVKLIIEANDGTEVLRVNYTMFPSHHKPYRSTTALRETRFESWQSDAEEGRSHYRSRQRNDPENQSGRHEDLGSMTYKRDISTVSPKSIHKKTMDRSTAGPGPSRLNNTESPVSSLGDDKYAPSVKVDNSTYLNYSPTFQEGLLVDALKTEKAEAEKNKKLKSFTPIQSEINAQDTIQDVMQNTTRAVESTKIDIPVKHGNALARIKWKAMAKSPSSELTAQLLSGTC